MIKPCAERRQSGKIRRTLRPKGALRNLDRVCILARRDGQRLWCGRLVPPPCGARKKAMSDLSTEFAGIQLKNPVITASGTFGYGEEFSELIDLDLLGGFVVKGLSAQPMKGAPPPRLHETASGMLNAIGLQNVGVRRFVSEKLPRLRKYDTQNLCECLWELHRGIC